MARDHGRVKVSIWDDLDFLALPSSAQHLYLALVTQPKLSYCGLLPLYPKRLARLASDLTAPRVNRSLATLEAARFVLTDDQTGELLVRTYVRHDGIIRQPNVAKAMAKAVIAVESVRLREAVTCELSRLYDETRDARGWDAIRDGWPDLYAKASGNPSPNPSGNPSVEPSPKGSPTPLPPSPFPLPSSGLGSQSANGSHPSGQSDRLDTAKIAAELGQDERWAARVIADVRSRAGQPIGTGYVLAAIKAEPQRYQPTIGPPPLDRLCDHGRDRLVCRDCATGG